MGGRRRRRRRRLLHRHPQKRDSIVHHDTTQKDDNDEESLWRDAITISTNCPDHSTKNCLLLLQIVGLEASPPTLFVRVVPTDDIPSNTFTSILTASSDDVPSLSVQQVTDQALAAFYDCHPDLCNKYDAQQLASLGAIWICQKTRDPEGRSQEFHWRRFMTMAHPEAGHHHDGSGRSHMEATSFVTNYSIDSTWWNGTTIRIHAQPGRYPISEWLGGDDRRFRRLRCDDHRWDDDTASSDNLYHHQDLLHGFVVVNKPGGIPCHPTVDNGKENVLYLVQQQQQQRYEFRRRRDGHQHHDGNPPSTSEEDDGDTRVTSVPHRLDTDTSGLQLVGSAAFASFLGKGLELKTIKNQTTTKHKSNTIHPSSEHQRKIDSDLDNTSGLVEATPLPSPSPLSLHPWTVEKKYRCLVGISNVVDYDRVKLLWMQRSIVTHYMDKNSKAPKTFVDTVATNEHIDSNTSFPNAVRPSWVECKLRIIDVGQLFPLEDHPHSDNNDLMALGAISSPSATLTSSPSSTPSLIHRLWKNPYYKPNGIRYVTEVCVELITGRTHQIRGQLSQLGCPIVGDTLYGGCNHNNPKQNYCIRPYNRMALQCYELSFPRPQWSSSTWSPITSKKSKCHPTRCLVPSSNGEYYHFTLQSAWWTAYILNHP